jgi:hypothetical protein
VAKCRQARLLLILSMVLGAHLALVWLLLSSHHLLVRSATGSLQLVWIPRTAPSEVAIEPGDTIHGPRKAIAHHRVDLTSGSPSIAESPPSEENNAIHSTPDWSQELGLAAKDAVAKELEKKKHEADFAHVFPAQPTSPTQFAWDYAATHRVESLPQGGLVIHINDNCVLLIFPLPFVGCAIGKKPANGGIFESMHK